MDTNILLMILIPSIMGGIVAIYFIKNRVYDPEMQAKRIRLANQYVKELEEELDYQTKRAKSLQNKVNGVKGSVGIHDKIDLDSTHGVSQAVKELLPQIAPFLPVQARELLNDPKIVDVALELYQKDPERAKDILARFIKPSKSAKSSSGQDTGVPDFNPDLAV